METAVLSIKVGDFFKFLWPFQKSWTLLYQIYLDIILVAYLLKLNTISTVHVSFVGSDKKKEKKMVVAAVPDRKSYVEFYGGPQN